VTVPPDRRTLSPVCASLAPLLRPNCRCNGGLSSPPLGVYGSGGGGVGGGRDPKPGLPAQARPGSPASSSGSNGLPVHVFRLPAIYGARRTPFQKAA